MNKLTFTMHSDTALTSITEAVKGK